MFGKELARKHAINVPYFIVEGWTALSQLTVKSLVKIFNLACLLFPFNSEILMFMYIILW